MRRVLAAAACILLCAGVCASAAPDTEVQFETASPLGNKDCGKSETAIGDLMADAIRSALKTDIALIASSELKPSDPPLPEGKTSLSALTGLVSYTDDPLAVIEITGQAIKAALERSISIYPQSNMGFLQVSGLQFTFDAEKPSGQRVTTVTLNGSPLSDSALYKVAVTNSMANGALGYWRVWAPEDVKLRNPDITITKALEAYLKANTRIDYGKLDRITAKPK